MIQNLLGTTEVSAIEELALGVSLFIIGSAVCMGLWIALFSMLRWVWHGDRIADEEDEA